MIFDLALNDVNTGLTGGNNGLNLGLERFQEYVPGLQPGNIYVISGETASAKSTLAMNNFIYNPYDDYIKNYKNEMDLKIFIWSCEMSLAMLGIRAISRRLWLEHNLLVDPNYILSRGKNRIRKDIFDKVKLMKDYFEEMSDYVEFFSTDNPTGIRNTVLEYANKTGKTYYKEVDTTDGKKRVFDKHVPNKKQLIVGLVDHISIAKRERGFSKKENIDKLIEYQIASRDMFNITWIDVQQLNRNIASTDRFKIGQIGPRLDDHKESSDSTDAANYVISLFNPQRYEISPFRGYTINRNDGGLADRIRFLYLLKNRQGQADIVLPLYFLGEAGILKELPKQQDMKQEYYDKINALKKIE